MAPRSLPLSLRQLRAATAALAGLAAIRAPAALAAGPRMAVGYLPAGVKSSRALAGPASAPDQQGSYVSFSSSTILFVFVPFALLSTPQMSAVFVNS